MKTKIRYTPHIHEKGKMEFCGKNVKDGTVFYTVDMEDVGYDTLSQFEAEVLSRLVSIESKIKKLERK